MGNVALGIAVAVAMLLFHIQEKKSELVKLVAVFYFRVLSGPGSGIFI